MVYFLAFFCLVNMDIKYLKTSDLIPYSKNAKKHPEDQVEHIANSIKTFGFQQPIVVDQDNVVVIGHGRLLAAKKLRLDTVPCVVLSELSEEEIKALRLADNKTNESEWDLDFLDDELAEIFDIDMSDFGFDILDDDEEEESEPEEDPWEDIERLDKHYGVPYQGNKSRIADIIINLLPSGNRLVDLFGGGVLSHIVLCSQVNGIAFYTMI